MSWTCTCVLLKHTKTSKCDEYGANVFALDMYGKNALSTVDLEISRETRSAEECGYPLGESSISHMQVKELLEKTMEFALRLRH